MTDQRDDASDVRDGDASREQDAVLQEAARLRDRMPSPLPELPRVDSAEHRVSSFLLEELGEFVPRVARGSEEADWLGDRREQTLGYLEAARVEGPRRGHTSKDDFDDHQTGLWDGDGDADQSAVRSVPSEELVGQRYRIIADLAKGGMSSIYRAEHVGLGKEFALKILAREYAGDARLRKYFGREAKILSQIEHPNIVQVIDYGIDDRHGAYLVMERLEGETLLARITRDGKLKRHQALDFALQIAEALHYVHGQNVVHYDVKSENVLLCPLPVSQRGQTLVKLIDFGLSRTEALGARLAQSEVAGTPTYMSPEQIEGEAPRPSMDIYSFGVVLYEMLVGRPPFQGSIEEVMLAHWQQPPPPPSSLLEEPLEESLEQLVLRTLAKRPEDRQASMGHVIYELRTVAEMAGLSLRRASPLKKTITGQHHPFARGASRQRQEMASPYPSVWIDPDGIILQANNAFAKFVAEKVENLVSTSISECRFAARFPELPGWIEEVFVEGRPHQQILVIPSVDDGTMSVLLSLAPLQGSRRKVGAVFGIVVPLNPQD